MKALKSISTPTAPLPRGCYSQAVFDGSYIFVAGQLPVDPETNQLIEGEIKALTNRVLDNIENILLEMNCSFANVVKVEVFMIDLNEAPGMNEIYAERFKNNCPPARQTIQVARLPMDARIEISCIAKVSQQ